MRKLQDIPSRVYEGNFEVLTAIHVILMALGWGLIVPVMLLTVRNTRHNSKIWFPAMK